MEWANSKGVIYYLQCKSLIFGRGKYARINYFFTKKKIDSYATCGIPTGYKVSETHTGMPVLKKI